VFAESGKCGLSWVAAGISSCVDRVDGGAGGVIVCWSWSRRVVAGVLYAVM
jgi:hypothetical protein